MPSPIGHAVAGAAIAWAVGPHDRIPARLRGLTLACVALAVAPDLDLLLPHGHRMASHSVGAVFAVGVMTILAIVVTGQVTRRFAWSVGAACIVAYASHLVLDWMAADPMPPRGIQILWPFTDRWYISGWDLFRGTARRPLFTAQSVRINLLAIAQELAILGPIALLVWLVAVKTPPRLPTQMPGGHHPPE